jgi:hypothetical protein
MCLLQAEEVHDCFVVIRGYTPDDMSAPDRTEAIALVTIVGVVQSVFGYPNEEAYWRDPRGELQHGCYEVTGSKWADQVHQYNRLTYGDEYNAPSLLRHFFIGSKDASAQFLARDLQLEAQPGVAFTEVLEEARRRLDRWALGHLG